MKEPSKIRLLSDQPIREDDKPELDGLGFHVYARVLARAILGTPGPFTVGIFGEWGTGKTSLMRMMKGHLAECPDVATMWFNAWRYEQEEHPIVPLVATIVRALEDNRRFLQKLEETGKSLVTALRAIGYAFSGKTKVGIPGFAEVEASFIARDMIDRAEELHPDPLLDRSLYYEAFERLTKLDLGDRTKIVVFIDDLDRCFPHHAIKLLESIKLVLSQPGFVFVLGVSRTIVEGYLEHRYRKEFGIEEFAGRSYLDKIVQLSFAIPPHVGRMKNLSETLLSKLDPTDVEVLKNILPVIGVACAANPRAALRFVNNLLVDKAIDESLAATEARNEIPIQYFAVTRALQQRWRNMYALLATSDQLCSTLAGWQSHELAVHAQSENRQESEAASMLVGDRNLQLLLLEHGTDWLKDAEMRTSAIQFLQTQRQEAAPGIGEGRIERDAYLWCPGTVDKRVHEIAAILADTGLAVTVNVLAPSAATALASRALVWFVGPQWRVWEDGELLREVSGALSIRPLLMVLHPEAKGSTLPGRMPTMLTLQLSDEDISLEDLQPLIAALMRARYETSASASGFGAVRGHASGV